MAEVQHKIATLLSADVVTYSGSLDTHEPAAFEALQARREIFNRLVTEYGGRQFGSVGDARMAEFPSASRALECAIAIQRAILEENDPLPLNDRILLRIGLHVGEVTVEPDGSLYGDGIAVAAQLQTLAVPGGISLSGFVHDQVKHAGRFEFTGEKRLRRSGDPILTYQVLEPGVEKGYQSLWAELKRRNVVRVGAAYAVVSWLLIQIATIVLPTFDAPRWALRATIVVLVVGFPVSLFLAWIYELTPFGVRRSDDVLRQASIHRITGRRLDGAIISLLAAAVLFLVFSNYDLLRSDGEAASSSSIAVLAFDNLSPDPRYGYFADGLADELLNVLARIPELRVAPRTSSFSFKGKNTDVATIASTLMVDNVLEGSVRADGDQIRVTSTLVRDGVVQWNATYDRSVNDLLDVQADIAYSVAAEIAPVLSPESKVRVAKHPTNNTEAYDYYLRGLDYLHRPADNDTLAIAIDMFGRAIELDSRFAAAWAARCAGRLSQYEVNAGQEEFFNDAEADCRRAWTLDNGLSEVYVALGRLYRMSGQYDDAVVELRTAIAQQPNAVEAYVELGNTLTLQNKLDEAEAMFTRAIALDGGNWDVYRNYGHFLYDNERYEEAIAQYSRVLDFTPDSGIGFDNLGNAYWAIGDFESAADAYRKAIELEHSRWAYSNLGSMQYYLGQYDASVENQKAAIELAPEDHVAWGRLAEASRFIPGKEKDVLDAYAKAIELVKKDLLINPDDWNNIGLLAVYDAFGGHPDEALAQVERMLTLAPMEPSAHYYDALVEWQLGDADATYEALKSALAFGMSPVFIVRDPTLAPALKEARFEALVELHGD